MRLLGIYRSERFSPNMVSNDAAILDAVADKLRKLGNEVETISEDKLNDLSYDISKYDKAFGMMRNEQTIKKLMEKNDEYKFINPLGGILDCNERVALLEIFMDEEINMPDCALYTHLGIKSNGEIDFPFWIKRGDGCAETKEDVSYITNNEEATHIVDNFKERNIHSFAVQKHIPGDLVKFYGVEGTDFFSWNYASQGHSKFGLEAINGKEQGFPFQPKELKMLADKAAKAIEVPIYGGDCIIDSSGKMYIIDFNDWPSFTNCRNDAAIAIAQRILQ
ncbi:MAG: hypothetical protein K6E54_08380 [Bacteroidaceae bacterium]|nr:hypothetical protein [Bacteroidaceae bacterium]